MDHGRLVTSFGVYTLSVKDFTHAMVFKFRSGNVGAAEGHHVTEGESIALIGGELDRAIFSICPVLPHLNIERSLRTDTINRVLQCAFIASCAGRSYPSLFYDVIM